MFPLTMTRFVIPIVLMDMLPQQVSVRYMRVRDVNGQERAVRIKGEYISGVIDLGDEVAFWGKWSDGQQSGGTLHMRRAYNMRLSTSVKLNTVDSMGAQIKRVLTWVILFGVGALILYSLLNG
jgi:hypothetical protein